MRTSSAGNKTRQPRLVNCSPGLEAGKESTLPTFSRPGLQDCAPAGLTTEVQRRNSPTDFWHTAPGERGVTLLELVIVLALLSLAVALVLPRFGNWIDEWTLRSTAERLAQTVRDARTRALYEQGYYLLEINPAARRIRIVGVRSHFEKEFEIPAGIGVDDGEVQPPSVVRLMFPPSGTVGDRTLTLRNRRGSSYSIHVDFLLGAPVVAASKKRA